MMNQISIYANNGNSINKFIDAINSDYNFFNNSKCLELERGNA